MANPSPDPLITNENDLRAKAIERIKRKRAVQDHVIVFLLVNMVLGLMATTNEKHDVNGIVGTLVGAATGFDINQLRLPAIAVIWLVILGIDAFRINRGRQGFATLLPLPLGGSLPVSDEQVSKEMQRMRGEAVVPMGLGARVRTRAAAPNLWRHARTPAGLNPVDCQGIGSGVKTAAAPVGESVVRRLIARRVLTDYRFRGSRFIQR